MSYYKLNKEDVLSKLNTNENGLDDAEVNARVQKYGLNKLKEAKKNSIIKKFIEQFKNLMLIILIISAILSAIVSIKTGEPYTDTIVILFVVMLNAILGVIQESKAEKAIEALKGMSLPYIKVRRNGNVESVKTEELVVGDIVLLEAGDSVPADMRILKNHSVRVEEAALTGESVPIDKSDKEIDSNKELSIGDRINMLYFGSSVVYGRCEAVVVATGMNTELGKIAEALTSQKVEITPLQKKINELSKVLSVIVVVIAVIMFIVGFIKGNPVLDVFMLAISLAVAAIPEGLSAVITITLAMGVQKMAKEKAIVRKLSAVEALGATEVICSDKTGTLTQNKMTLRKIFIDNKLINVDNVNNLEDIISIDVNNKDLKKLINSIVLCNDTTYGEESGNKVLLGDPTETCLVEFSEKLGFEKETMDEMFERIDELPFDSTRKMMTTVNSIEGKCYTFTKGALESVIESCTKILIDDKICELTNQLKEDIINKNMEMANEALRVLACAYRENNSYEENSKEEKDLIFIGLVGMIDPPRKEAKRAVEKCYTAGMIPIMITGDNIDTANAIARELGILTDEYKSITGLEIDKMSDEQLFNEVEKIRVYARVSPENKTRIVKAWKKHGKTVAMTGDGVNDAPAIKTADIGVGMGITGTEVSKSVSSMVLADDNFATIVVAVKEGRRIYNNIIHVITYLLASNLAEILIIFISTLLNNTLLLPIQILWINLVSDTLPAIALGFEKEERGIMHEKPRNANTSIFTPFLITRVVVFGILKALLVFIMYGILSDSYSDVIAKSSVFVTLCLVEILFSFICRSDKKSVFEIGLFTNIPMILCIVGALLLHVVILAIPALSNVLGIASLTKNVYLIIALTTICAVIALELVKLVIAKIFNKRY